MSVYVLGIDLGTSGCKMVLADEKLNIVHSSLIGYPLDSPKPGWYEQDTGLWWDAVKKGIKSITSKVDDINKIKAIGFSGQMHGLVAVNKDMTAVRPCMIWADFRNETQCDQIYDMVGGEKALLKLTNNKMLTAYTGGKILWMMQNEPELFDQTVCVINPKDYIRLCLTGELATDMSDASGTGLLDVKHRSWCYELTDKIGIPRRILPKIYESNEIAGYVKPEVARELGLPENLPVAAGGGDAIVQTTGTGVIRQGVFNTTIGTGGIVATSLDKFCENADGNLQIFCNNVPGKWHAMGVMLGAGGALKWIKEILCISEIETAKLTGRNVYDLMTEEAAGVEPGAEGLLFLPFLLGQRCPYADAKSRAAFIGLTPRHDKRHLIRSLMEGVVLSLKDMSDLIVKLGTDLTQIRASGGGSSSALWRQMQADIFNADVFTMNNSADGGALGAAILGGLSVGVWDNIEEAAALLEIETTTYANKCGIGQYEKLLDAYKKIYPGLKPVFDSIVTL